MLKDSLEYILSTEVQFESVFRTLNGGKHLLIMYDFSCKKKTF